MESMEEIDVLGTVYQNSTDYGEKLISPFPMPRYHATIKFIFPFIDILRHSTAMFRRDSLYDILHYDETKNAFNGYHLFLDLLFNKHPDDFEVIFSIIPEILVLTNVQEDPSLSSEKDASELAILDARRVEILGQVYSSVNDDGGFD